MGRGLIGKVASSASISLPQVRDDQDTLSYWRHIHETLTGSRSEQYSGSTFGALHLRGAVSYSHRVLSMTPDDEILRLRKENAHLRALLERSFPDQNPNPARGRSLGEPYESCSQNSAQTAGQGDARLNWEGTEHELTKEQVVRYSRQIILPSFGAQGLSPNSVHMETYNSLCGCAMSRAFGRGIMV